MPRYEVGNQIKTITSKLKKLIYVMKQLREIIKRKNIRMIYLTLIEPHITYGIIGWGGAFDNALSQLQICQNKIIKVGNKKDWRYSSKKL